MKVTEKKGYRG